MEKRPAISIRTKLTIAFLFVFLIPVLTMLWLLSGRLEMAFNKLEQPRLKNALTALQADFANRKTTVALQAQALAENKLITDTVHLSSDSNYETQLGNLNINLESLGKSTRLHFIRIVNREKILANYPKYMFNEPLPPEDLYFVKKAYRGETPIRIGEQEYLNDQDQPQRVLAITAYYPVRYQRSLEKREHAATEAVVVGGAIISGSYLERLNKLSNALILFFQGREFMASYPEIPFSQDLVEDSFLNEIDSEPQSNFIAPLAGSEYLFGGLPIRSPDSKKPVGYFVLGVSREHLLGIKSKTRENVLYVAMLGGGLSLILAALISLGITRPISDLARSAQLIGRGRFLEARNTVNTGDEVGLLGSAMNIMIDDIKAYSERLAMSERVAAWRDIARSIAHEIKNPLSPIQLSIENMRAAYEQNPEAFRDLFDESTTTVLEEVEKLRRLANEFSAFARMPKPAFEKVDLVEVLNNVTALYAKGHSGIRTSILSDRDRGLFVRADRDQLNRAFSNLIKNAIQAMPDGGELKVIIRHVNDEIFVVVEDTGVGMDSEELTKIFTPYYTTKDSGSGLGLPMVQRIFQDHEAGLDVYSEKGVGTKFIIAFKEIAETTLSGA